MDGVRVEVAGNGLDLLEAHQTITDEGVRVGLDDGDLVFEFPQDYLAGLDILDRAGVVYEVRGFRTKEVGRVA
jgi:hypothetical protein